MAIANAQLKKADEVAGVNALNSPRLKQHKLMNILAEEMSERVKKGYLYPSLRGTKMFFIFSHNGFKIEFDRELDSFKQRIRPIYKEHKMKEFLYFTKIVSLVNNRRAKRKEKPNKYIDIAKGEFNNQAKSKAIHKLFEEIRGHIKENQ